MTAILNKSLDNWVDRVDTRDMATNLQSVIDTIEQIASNPKNGERFIPTRYPYTYGWDYMRQHHIEFGWLGTMPSRADVSRWASECLGTKGAAEIAAVLADAYLREHHVERQEIMDVV